MKAENQALRGDGAAANGGDGAAVEDEIATVANADDAEVANAVNDMPAAPDMLEAIKKLSVKFDENKNNFLNHLITKITRKRTPLIAIDLRDIDFNHWQPIKKYTFTKDLTLEANGFSFRVDRVSHIGIYNKKNNVALETKWKGVYILEDQNVGVTCKRDITALITTGDCHFYYNTKKGKLAHDCIMTRGEVEARERKRQELKDRQNRED